MSGGVCGRSCDVSRQAAINTPNARALAKLVNSWARALNRVQAAIRVELARVALDGPDRKLFDDYARDNRELVAQLFDDSQQIRFAAVKRLPLKPDSGAGVFIALKVNDSDGDVAEAALESALRLKDTVVARCLTHYVRSVAEALRTGFFGPDNQDAAAISAQYVRRSIEVIGAAKYREAAPVVAEALLQLGKSPYAMPGFFELPPIAEALANLGDRRAAGVMLAFLDHAGSSRVAPLGPGRMLTITVGDEILLMLCRLYDQKPPDFGMLTSEAGVSGYADDDARQEGHRKFRIWYREHGEPPTSQPAAWPAGRPPADAPQPASRSTAPLKKDGP